MNHLDQRYGIGVLDEFIQVLQDCQPGAITVDQEITDRNGVLLKCVWQTEQGADHAYFEWLDKVWYVHWLSATCVNDDTTQNHDLHERILECLPPFGKSHDIEWVVVEVVLPSFIRDFMSQGPWVLRRITDGLPKGIEHIRSTTYFLTWEL